MADSNAAPQTHLQYRGLTAAEVELSRQKHGRNIMTPPEREPWWKQFLEKFDDPVIRILIIAAVISIAVGVVENRYAEGIGIIMAILLATTLAFLNEYKANREFDILNKVNDDVPIKVLRDGHFTTVPRQELVVGDIVFIEVGEETPADGRLVEAVALQVNESRLTGEAMPASKYATGTLPAEADHEATYGADKILRGTMVVDGHGVMEVTAVGDRTEIGQTARAAAEETGEETPLNVQLEKLSKMIGVVGLGAAAVTFLALVVRGAFTMTTVNGERVPELNLSTPQWTFALILMLGVLVALVRVWLPILYDALAMAGKESEPPGWLENDSIVGWLVAAGIGAAVFAVAAGICYAAGLIPAAPAEWLPYEAARRLLLYFMIAVTIIVVAVPEGLAMSVTLSLAYSMRKMTAANNLVRRMHACETIGAATVICSDKTGTLTMNEMRVADVSLPAGCAPLTTTGAPSEQAQFLAEAIACNTTAHLSRIPGEPIKVIGNPTEGALLLWLDSQGMDYINYRTDFSVDYQLTFSTERKYMATLGTSRLTGRKVLHVKGAPEMLLSRCATVLTDTGPQALEDRRQPIETALKEYQRRGMRTLGLAYRELHTDQKGAEIEQLVADLTWLGFLAIADPVRPEVPPAIEACREAGVQVKIVTGDNQETAQEIAAQIGLWQPGDTADSHITGPAFGALTEDEARTAAGRLKVLSRARPTDKMRLVRLLQEQGEVVAVTGDGTNDAPALNHANVGLAMGKTGTSVAKEASDIILLDDSFRSIVNAIMWGRSLYQNIQRFILFQLTINVVALGIAMLGPFIGIELPLTVTQMLWVNLIMDTFAALALATEPAHADVLSRPPRKSTDFIITRDMAYLIFGVGGIFLAVLLGFLLYILHVYDPQFVAGQPPEVAEENRRYILSVFFSVFVLLQFWNLFNARTLGSNRSAFAGLLENRGFILIALAILVGQIVLVQFGGDIFRTRALSFRDWAVIIAATSPVLWIGELLRLISRGKEGTPAPALLLKA